MRHAPKGIHFQERFLTMDPGVEIDQVRGVGESRLLEQDLDLLPVRGRDRVEFNHAGAYPDCGVGL